jgi:hypothetical protein
MRLWWVILLMVMQVWRPHPGAQERFLATPAFEALFGGAAGPGKTDCLLMEALRQIEHPRYNGILFRRTFPMLDAADGLIARSKRWYPGFGATYNESKHVWAFPSGAHIYFGHLQYEADLEDHQSAQYQFIGFDELTQFTERMYLYMFSRCWADVGSGLRCYIRGATNPGGIGHIWVKGRFVTAGVLNRLGYFARVDDQDTRVDKTHPDALSRVFIPARHLDNPVTSAQYAVRLRLEDGDWDAEYKDGIYDNWSVQNISSDKAHYHNQTFGLVPILAIAEVIPLRG